MEIIFLILVGISGVLSGPTHQNNPVCITSCSGKRDGFYPSCKGCEYYLYCYYGTVDSNDECDRGTLWRDDTKSCDLAQYVTCADGSRRPDNIPMSEPDYDNDYVDDTTKDTASADDKADDNITDCLVWTVLACAAILGLLICIGVFCCVKWCQICGAKSKMADASTQMSSRRASLISRAPAYEDVVNETQPTCPRYVALPRLVDGESNHAYQELFPFYQDLNAYRDGYLQLHEYTYLQLSQHARNDVTRREIARSVGPIYLTLCSQYESSPKAYESTQSRLRALVDDLWREKPAYTKTAESPLKKKR